MIDLQLTLFEFQQTLNWKVAKRRQQSSSKDYNPNEIKITFQFLHKIEINGKEEHQIPLSFFIQRQDIVVNCFLKDVEAKFGLSTSEDFYFDSLKLTPIIEKFIAFLYCGKLQFDHLEYLSFIKLGIHFQCKELVIELLKNFPQQNPVKSGFMSFLIYAQKYFEQLDISLTNRIIEKILLSNRETLINHPQYKKKYSREVIITAIQKMTYSNFLLFFNIYLKNNKKIELTYLIHFLNVYGNPQVSEMEALYIQMMIDNMDENLYLEIRNILSEQAKSVFENHLKVKANTTICHFIHSKVCNIINKQFVAHCGHQICLNCFFEYFIFKTLKLGEQQPINQVKYKIKCLSHYIDAKICCETFNSQDFQQLVPYFSNEHIENYLN